MRDYYGTFESEDDLLTQYLEDNELDEALRDIVQEELRDLLIEDGWGKFYWRY